MKMPITKQSNVDKALYWLAIAIILFGVALRVMIFFKNNSLFIDEANVALNIYDRSILQLFTPLDNNQYAPPGFLVILKLLTSLFGYSEYVFRSYTLLSGIAALFLMLAILKKYISLNVLWYPLCIMAVGFVYIRYGALVKQYSSDIVVTLSLILLALKYDILTTSIKRFTMVWMLAGAIAIWFSMPSVFVLASIGICYSLAVLRSKEHRKFVPLLIIGAFWLLNFGIYYSILLKYQVSSDYLQVWHHKYFLNAFPANLEEMRRNWRVIKQLVSSMGGAWKFSLVFHFSMMAIGAAYLLRKDTFKGMLIILPILFCIVAVCMHKYTMIDRVMLFALPLILLLIGAGMQALFDLKVKAVNALVIIWGVIGIFNFSELKELSAKSESEEISKNLDFVLEQGVDGEHLYIHIFALPAARYYMEVHPAKERYRSLKNFHPFMYETNMDSVGALIKERTAVLYSFEEWEIIQDNIWAIEKHANRVANNAVPVGYVSIYEKK